MIIIFIKKEKTPNTWLSTDSRAVKGDRLKICCVSFVGSNPTSCTLLPYSVMVIIWPFQGRDPGSIPGMGMFFLHSSVG